MDVCEYRFSARFSFWHIKEWKGIFKAGSGWRTLTCVLVYVYAYAIGYSYYRRGELEV